MSSAVELIVEPKAVVRAAVERSEPVAGLVGRTFVVQASFVEASFVEASFVEASFVEASFVEASGV